MEKKFLDTCPNCKIEFERYKRSIGKLCQKCNMKQVEEKYRYMKLRPDKPTMAEYCRKHAVKYKDDRWHRLNRLMQGARHRAKINNLLVDITTDYLMDIFPKDNKCPVFGIELKFNSFGKNGDRSDSPSIDRLNPLKGYTKDNVRIISWKANEAKRNSTIEMLEAILKYMKA